MCERDRVGCKMGSDISKCCNRGLGRIAARTTQRIRQTGGV